MSENEELTRVDQSITFVRWHRPKTWRDWIILMDMELGVWFGWGT